MQRKEVLELKNRLKKDKATFSNMATCYVDANKTKVAVSNSKFLTLDEEEYYKYLEVAKKTLSGKLGNNLINLDFPVEEEATGGRQQILMALRDSDFGDENLLNTYFDLIIDTYDRAGNYLIVLFLDNYDVMSRTNDNINLDESEEVYKYILCSICPVELAKPALGYKTEEQKIGARERDWVVGAPESGFLFPAFNDRSTDIHSVLFYTKNTKDPHAEFMINGLGCDVKHTSDEKKIAFNSMIGTYMNGDEDDEIKLDVNVGLSGRIEEHEEKNNDTAPIVADKSFIEKALEESNVPSDKARLIAGAYVDAFANETTTADELVDEKFIKDNEIVLEKRDLEEENLKLKEQLDALNTDSEDEISEKFAIDELEMLYATQYDSDNDDVPSFLEWLKTVRKVAM